MLLVQKMVATTIATCTALAGAGTLVLAQKSDKAAEAKRPKVTLKVNPQVVVAPGRVTLTAELQGGAEISERDHHRWELDPDSKDDFGDDD